MQEALITFKPDIVHFSVNSIYEQQGISSEIDDDSIIFEGDDGKTKLVQLNTVLKLFEITDKKVNCVVLNTCKSDKQAQKLSNYIDYAIGIQNMITDDNAASFSGSLYKYLSMEEPIEQAVRRAKLDVEINSPDMPFIVLFNKGEVV